MWLNSLDLIGCARKVLNDIDQIREKSSCVCVRSVSFSQVRMGRVFVSIRVRGANVYCGGVGAAAAAVAMIRRVQSQLDMYTLQHGMWGNAGQVD